LEISLKKSHVNLFGMILLIKKEKFHFLFYLKNYQWCII